ncbi:MAG TPA: serine/threonine-protein kinase [Polyangiaceae bacterium]|nr:serine/threonine-protein kinase [Polyangiaceae bacterium]
MESSGTGSATLDKASLVGELIADRYRVEQLLGEGGMGAVYRATHVQLQKTVALKVLHAHMTEVAEAVLRFEREAVASARVEHPNVVNATDFGSLADGSFFLVLEYIAGPTLADLIEKGPLPEPRALHIAKQIVQALGAAHAHDIVHRDLKPENVMLVEKDGDPDFVKVLDFGIAKLSATKETRTALTRFGTVFGTPQYMAPEQAAGRTVDGRADLYAVGVILYEMLCGRPPFDADDLLVLLTQQMTQPPPRLPSWVTPNTAALVMQLLEKEPEARPQSATDLLPALSGQSMPRSGVRRKMPELPHLSTLWRKLPQRVRLAGFGIGAALIAMLAFLKFHHSGSLSGASRTAPLAERMPQDASELLERALRGDSKAAADLEELAKDEPSSVHWLAVGRARKAAGKLNDALAAYSAAVKIDSQAQNDSSLLSDVRQLAVADSIYEQVLNFAASNLGSSGVDLLIDVWLSEQGATIPAKRAKKLLEDDQLRKKASAAALMAIKLRESNGCAEHKALLPQAKADADERSLIPLKRLLSRRGCGFLTLSDCYSCLRGNTDLADAIAAAQGRSAPSFAATGAAAPSPSGTAPASR